MSLINDNSSYKPKIKIVPRFEDSRGRYLVAENKIKRGEIVAVESPIVAFPILHEWKVDEN